MLKLKPTKQAIKFINQLPPKQYKQIIRTTLSLLENPLPHDSQSLKGYDELRRVDIGEYRIIYQVEDDTVIIALIGKRNDDDVYKKLNRK